MKIRQFLADRPYLATVLSLMLLAVAGFLIVRGWNSSSVGPAAANAFFTTDDGQNTFVASRDTLAPFDHDGKPAVKVHMFSCDGGKTTFIGYLSKLPSEDKKAFEAAVEKAKSSDAPSPTPPMTMLVKKPGQTQWISSRSPSAGAVMDINCDGGFPETIHPD